MTDPTPEDVERVARAIYEAEKPSHHGGWESFCSVAGNKEWQMKVARASIAALPDHSALIRELRDALNIAERALDEARDWIVRSGVAHPSAIIHGDGRGAAIWPAQVQARAALRRADEALGEKP